MVSKISRISKIQLLQSIKKRYMKGGFLTFSDTIKKEVVCTVIAVYKRGRSVFLIISEAKLVREIARS